MMSLERTLSIIKPDATARNLCGRVLAVLESGGLRVVGQKRVLWTRESAESFYSVHRDRPFFADLVSFMTSGPIVLQVLEGEDAVSRHRELLGATNPSEAAEGTVRALFGESVERNSVHGSDSVENAEKEIAMTFSEDEIVG